MNKQSGRIGLYLVLIVMLVAGYFYLNNQVASQSSYSMESMKQAAEDGNIIFIRFRLGTIWLHLKSKHLPLMGMRC